MNSYLFRWLALLTLALSSLLPSQAQTKSYTISGHVLDAQSRETLIGATIFSPETNQGAYTNAYGFFSLTLTKPVKSLRVSYVGYETRTIELSPDSLMRPLTVEIKVSELQEVVVTSDRRQMRTPVAGALEVPIHIIKTTPALLGENDLMKSLQLMPGVKGGSDGSAGVHVRGGGVDENLILLDGVPVYNVDHLLGFFSVFTPEAVKKVDLYKGSFPARYGGRLSSVIDVRTNDGNLQKLRGALSVGLLSAKAHIEGPIIKGKTSFTLSARRSYLDLLIQPFLKDEDNKGGYYFYDINAKIQHRFNDKNRLYLSFYRGIDRFHAEGEEVNTQRRKSSEYEGDLHWGNLLTTLRWNHVFSSKLYSDLTLSYTRYHFEIGSEDKIYSDDKLLERVKAQYKSGIQDYAIGWNMHYYHSPELELRTGIDFLRHRFEPEAFGYRSSGNNPNTPNIEQKQPHILASDLALYAESKVKLGNQILLNAGLRGTLYAVDKRSYLSLQPRADLDIRLSDKLSAQLAYARMVQHVHLLTSATMTLPTDLWVTSTGRIRPMTSDQLSLGVKYEIAQGWSLGADVYFKAMKNILEYKDGATFIGSSTGWEDKVEIGVGRAYGLELMLMKQTGRTTGWLGYTLARSERRFDNRSINLGKWFPYKYDRTHHLNLVVSHKLSPRWDISASWEFYSGGYITLGIEQMELIVPQRKWSISGAPSDQEITQGQYIPQRNNFRLPSTHRLNLSLNYTKQHKKGRRSIWNFSVFNAYNAKNPSFVIPKDIFSVGENRHRITQFTLLPIIPSVSYTYSF